MKIDRFGNGITNISESALANDAASYEISVGNTQLKQINRAYAESEVGETAGNYWKLWVVRNLL